MINKNALLLLFTMLMPLFLFSQNTTDSLVYKKKKLKSTEIDILYSYYNQDGNNSAVTGGIGTEKLTDHTPSISVTMLFGDKKGNEHSLSVDATFDFYSSASSDNIDPRDISSASSKDLRIGPSVSWKFTNLQKLYSIGSNLSFSTEYDYTSAGIGASFSKFSKDRNRDLSLHVQTYFDNWSVIYPVELRSLYYGNGSESANAIHRVPSRNSYSVSAVYTQVFSKRMQVALLGDVVYQNGLLSTPFHRVYFKDSMQATIERLPGSRLKIPLGLRWNYFFSDFVIARTYYRYYRDDWGLAAHTFSIEIPFKITPAFSVYPFYRFYTQTAVDYFAAYKEHVPQNEFYTSDYDLSAFTSHFFGGGLKISPPNGIFRFGKIFSKGTNTLGSAEIRYGRYTRSTGLYSNIVTLHLKWK